MSPGSGRCPGCNTQQPPNSSTPNTSSANASQETGEHCRNTSPGLKSTYSWEQYVPTRARCGDITAFGRPVEPDVNTTHARSSGPACDSQPMESSSKGLPSSTSTQISRAPVPARD